MYKPLVKWVHEHLQAGRASKAPELTDEAIEEFRHDDNFLKGEFRNFLYAQIRDILAQTRGPIMVNTKMGTPVMGNGLQPVVVTWQEHIKSKGHMFLTDMRKADLTEAINERKHRIQAEGRRLLFLEAVRRGLKDGKQTVGERYDAEQLESMRRRYEEGTGGTDDRVNGRVEKLTEEVRPE